MFCGKCGTPCQDDALFCAKCGNRLAIPESENMHNPAQTEPLICSAPEQPTDQPQQTACNPQQPTYGSYQQMPNPAYPNPYQQNPPYPMPDYGMYGMQPKKKLLPWIIGAVAAAAVIALVLIFLLGGNSGYSDPEELALDFAKAVTNFDVDDLEDTMYPGVLDSDRWSSICEVMEDTMEEREKYGLDIETKNFEVDDVYDNYDRGDYRDFEDYFEEYCGIEVDVEDALTYEISFVRYLNGEKFNLSGEVTVVKIDGSWYAYPESVY